MKRGDESILFNEEFKIYSQNRVSFTAITAEVAAVVKKSGIKEGFAVIFIPHTTAGVTLNENADPDVVTDMKAIIENLVPREGLYRHREGNTSAHMMTSLMGSSQQIIIRGGKLLLGTWQGIFLIDFDGPRERKVLVQIQGEK